MAESARVEFHLDHLGAIKPEWSRWNSTLQNHPALEFRLESKFQ